jgi:catechol 2,3-dioxygenase-like lactoylglutathione lyase family enzyme
MRFDHVGVLVDDLESAKTFARDVLGLGLDGEFEAPEQGLAGAFFGLGTGKLELFTLSQPRAFGIDHVAVVVDDLDAERERLAAQGVRFTGPMLPDHVDEPIELRGARHLWTDPETSGGFRVQLIEKP